jgi:hypothetical protein
VYETPQALVMVFLSRWCRSGNCFRLRQSPENNGQDDDQNHDQQDRDHPRALETPCGEIVLRLPPTFRPFCEILIAPLADGFVYALET